MKQPAEPEGFAEFWSLYPRKVAKGAARIAFARALKKTDLATIMAGLKRYALQRAGQDPQYTAHASTWLNHERWADEPCKPLGAPKGNGELAPEQKAELRRWHEERGMHIPIKLRGH